MGNIKSFSIGQRPLLLQLSTSTESIPNRLGPVSFELGVIAGDRSINLILSAMIPGKDDGKVSVNRTRVEGMKDFIMVHFFSPIFDESSTCPRTDTSFFENRKIHQRIVIFTAYLRSCLIPFKLMS